MIHIGFTGTQRGMTDAQGERVLELLHHRDFYAHHGCCVGANEHFDLIARRCPHLRGLVFHPCNLPNKQFKFAREILRDAVRPIKDPLARNRDIVAECAAIIATPKEAQMQMRSGTWSTIRYARAAGKPLAIVLPNGAIAYEGASWP